MVRIPLLMTAATLCSVSFFVAPSAAAEKATAALNDERQEGGRETVVNPGPDIRIEVKVQRAVVKRGEKSKTPIVTVELVNHEKDPVVVIRPGDGSDCGWRTPVITWYLDEKKCSGIGGCANINPLQAKEIVELKAGGRLRLEEWLGVPPMEHFKPGIHHLYVEYDHRPDMKWGVFPRKTPESKTMERIRNSQPIKAVSNVVEIRVEE